MLQWLQVRLAFAGVVMWLMRYARQLTVAVVALVAVAAPNAVADDLVEQILPPNELRADYNDENHTIVLKWSPPSDSDESFTYRVYRNGVPLGETGHTWYEAALPGSHNVFHVTAWLNGNESAPSQPVVAQQQSSGGDGNSGLITSHLDFVEGQGPFPQCSILIIATYTQWPFIGYGIQEWCIPVVGGYISVEEPVDMILG